MGMLGRLAAAAGVGEQATAGPGQHRGKAGGGIAPGGHVGGGLVVGGLGDGFGGHAADVHASAGGAGGLGEDVDFSIKASRATSPSTSGATLEESRESRLLH